MKSASRSSNLSAAPPRKSNALSSFSSESTPRNARGQHQLSILREIVLEEHDDPLRLLSSQLAEYPEESPPLRQHLDDLGHVGSFLRKSATTLSSTLACFLGDACTDQYLLAKGKLIIADRIALVATANTSDLGGVRLIALPIAFHIAWFSLITQKMQGEISPLSSNSCEKPYLDSVVGRELVFLVKSRSFH